MFRYLMIPYSEVRSGGPEGRPEGYERVQVLNTFTLQTGSNMISHGHHKFDYSSVLTVRVHEIPIYCPHSYCYHCMALKSTSFTMRPVYFSAGYTAHAYDKTKFEGIVMKPSPPFQGSFDVLRIDHLTSCSFNERFPATTY